MIGKNGQCPHCLRQVRFLPAPARIQRAHGPDIQPELGAVFLDKLGVLFAKCPGCEKLIVALSDGTSARYIYPRSTGRAPIHSAVPEYLKQDYEEAVAVSGDSPKASAALSRRCLQTLLVKNGATKRDLIDQINEIAPSLPSYLQETIDHIRQIGNISAHAKEHASSGEIVDVEPGEAEWLLHVLEELFDHFYAKPAIAKERASAISAKLASAKKLSGS